MQYFSYSDISELYVSDLLLLALRNTFKLHLKALFASAFQVKIQMS